MVSTGGIRAGKAFVEMYVNDKPLNIGLALAQAKLKAFSAQTERFGRQLTAVAATVALPLIAGSKVYADFEKQMAQVSTMLDDPAAHMEKFRENIRLMQVEFGESSEALANGLYDILSASIPAGQALDVLAVAAKAAQAGITDTGTAADAITTILNSYGLEAENAADVSDWLFTVVKRGKTTFAELAPTIGLVASTASSAGLSLDVLGATIATLTRSGVRTENAITAVNQVISAFLKPTGEAVSLAHDLGFEMSSAVLATEGLEGVFKRISHLPPDVIAKLFPNIRALRGVIPALKNLDGLSDDISAMGKRTGATEAAFAKMSNTISFKFNQMKQTVVVALGRIGEALAGSLGDAFDKVTKFAKAVGKWATQNRELVVSIAKWTIAIGAAGVALIAIAKLATATSVALGILVGATNAATVAFAFMLANPVVAGLAAIAVVAGVLGVAMYRASSGAKELSNSMSEELDRTDKLRAADRALIAELTELSKKQKRTILEQIRARDIIEQLSRKYDNLGLSINRVTGAIEGVSGATRQMNKDMRESERLQIAAAMQQLSNNVQELNRQQVYAKEGFFRGWFGFSSAESEDRKVKRLADKAKALLLELAGLRERLREGPGGEPGTPGGAGDATGAGIPDSKELEFQRGLQVRFHQERIRQIEDEQAKAIAASRMRFYEEIRQAKLAGHEVARLYTLAQQDQTNIRKKFAAEAAAEDAKLAKRAEEDKATVAEDLAMGIAELRIKTSKDGLEERLALLGLEEQRAARAAAQVGIDAKWVKKKFELERKLARQEESAGKRRSFSVSGTFSGAVASRMAGTGHDARMLTATERSARDIHEIRRQIKQNVVRFQ